MILNEKNLKNYAKNKFNVLLSGRHGVGKTEIIKSVFNELYGDRWAYFSASTMDAWVDFIGVPKPIERKDGSVVLGLIKPERFADDKVEALFFDEFNRAPAKVRNAVMELIQFKSINGKKFNNLKVVWAAINPSDEGDYFDVEDLDAAQEDRFEIQIDMPYKLSEKYFDEMYGYKAKPFMEWWKSLDKEIQYLISPRRLDSAIRVHSVKGRLEDCLPKKSNISDLKKRIKNNSINYEWEKNVIELNHIEREIYFQNISNVKKFEDKILENFKDFIEYVPQDYVISKYESERDKEWCKKSVICLKYVPLEIKMEYKLIEKTLDQSFLDKMQKLGRFTLPNKSNKSQNIDISDLLS
jgi:hypothetical protein